MLVIVSIVLGHTRAVALWFSIPRSTTMRAPEAEAEDSLDAYMASLEIPDIDREAASMAHARAESPAVRAHAVPRSGGDAVVKNRRFRRLQQLLLTSEGDAEEDRYFSDTLMQQRSPALFHFYLGQYLGLDRGATDTRAPPADSSMFSLSSFLLATSQRSEMEARRVAEQQTWGNFTSADDREAERRRRRLLEEDNDVEEDEETDDEEEGKEEKGGEEARNGAFKSLVERREQLIEAMSVRFLHGDDNEYVNYAEIDADEALDDLEQMQRDAEERYFAEGSEAQR
ncbi:hypothetical protein BBJ28_00019272 [Nothophytophthora sp. Chile5]|nr:hypothetical protein BBJ28_00019272 [Nothophytophthora sp. Chile5]